MRVLPNGAGDARCRAAESEQVHDRDRIELHAKQAHRGPAKAFGLAVHRLVGAFVGRKDLQRRKPLDILQKRRPQVDIGTPIAAHRAFRYLLNGDDRDGDERHAGQQYRGGGKRKRRKADEQRRRSQHRIEQLRKIRAEVALQLLGSFDAHLDRGGRRGVLAIPGAQSDQFVVHASPDDALRPLCSRRSGTHGRRLAEEADGDREQADADEQGQLAGACLPFQQQPEKPACGDEQGHVGKQCGPLQDDARRDGALRCRNHGEKTFIEHASSFHPKKKPRLMFAIAYFMLPENPSL